MRWACILDPYWEMTLALRFTATPSLLKAYLKPGLLLSRIFLFSLGPNTLIRALKHTETGFA